MRSLHLLSLIALASCAMELALPEPPTEGPPRPVSVTPSAVFAGETIVVQGEGLGSAATTRVFVGGQQAALAATSTAGMLTAVVPEGLGVGAHELRVVTSAGEGLMPDAVEYLGLGHPRGFALRADLELRPRPSFAFAGEDRTFVLDWTNDQQFQINALTGNANGRPMQTPPNPLLSFGNDAVQWIYAFNSIGKRPRMYRYAWGDESAELTCDSGELAGFDTSTFPVASRNAATNADGTLLAVPLGGREVLLVDARTCPPVTRVVDMGSKVESLVVSGNDVVLALFDRFARIKADGTVVLGAPLEDGYEVAYYDGAMALAPGERRAAYERFDGDVGFLTWDEEGGAPVVAPETLFTYAGVLRLAYGRYDAPDPARRLYVLHSDRVATYDLEESEFLTSASIPTANWIEPLPTGEVLVATTTGTTLLSVDGAIIRTWELSTAVPIYGLAMGDDRRVLMAGENGARSLASDLTDSHVSFAPDHEALALDGVASLSGGAPIGWKGATLYGYDTETREWAASTLLASTHLVRQAARSSDGSIAVAVTREGALHRVQVVDETGTRAVEFPDATKVNAIFADGVLQVAVQTPSTITLERRDPHSLALLSPAVTMTPPAEFEMPVLRLPYWSRALDAVVVPVSNERSYGDGTHTYIAAVLHAVGRDGVVAQSPVLPRALSNPIAFSPDGRLFISAENRSVAGIDAGLVSRQNGALVVTSFAHQDLPGIVSDAVFTPTGDGLYVVFPVRGLLGLLE